LRSQSCYKNSNNNNNNNNISVYDEVKNVQFYLYIGNITF